MVTGTTTASEELLIALAAGEFGDLLALVDQHKAELLLIEQAAAAEAKAVYQAAVDDWLAYVTPIVLNNPGKDFGQIFGRADVMSQLAGAMDAAASDVRDTVTGAFLVGQELGGTHAAAELVALGLDGVDIPFLESSGYLESVLSDLDKNATESIGRILGAAESGFNIPELDTTDAATQNVRRAFANERLAELRKTTDLEARKLSNSASAGASVAANNSYSQAQLRAYAAAGAENGVVIRKVWVTNFSPTTCGTCASLHGTVVDIEQGFDPLQTFAAKPLPVYHNLQTPPRHPHCHCRIMPYTEDLGGGEVSPATMQDYAKGVAEETKGMAPATFPKQVPNFSQTSKTTPFMEAADIKAMSDGQFTGAVDSFIQCILNKVTPGPGIAPP